MIRRILATIALAAAVAGCGSSSSHSATAAGGSGAGTTTATSTAPATPPAVAELAAAEHPAAARFPAPRGRTLQQLANSATTTASLGAATGTFVPGRQRFAFALTTNTGAFVYAPTAVYVAPTPHSRAQGPYVAAADPLTVPPRYRSAQNAGPGGIQAIYAAQLPLPKRGTYAVLALTRSPHGLIGAAGELAVAPRSPIPAVGQRAPAIDTDTLASAGGHASLLTTRTPPDDMHAVSLRQVLGKRPVALLFSTPQLCVSKVCGPVTDIAVMLERRYGKQITFIHEEVYAGNQPSHGLRPQMKAFHLETEPWLFTIDRRGVIAARLEGSFGVGAFAQALQAALR